MLRHSDRSIGFGTFGMMVRCSFFQFFGHSPVALMALNISEIGRIAADDVGQRILLDHGIQLLGGTMQGFRSRGLKWCQSPMCLVNQQEWAALSCSNVAKVCQNLITDFSGLLSREDVPNRPLLLGGRGGKLSRRKNSFPDFLPPTFCQRMILASFLSVPVGLGQLPTRHNSCLPSCISGSSSSKVSLYIWRSRGTRWISSGLLQVGNVCR